MPPVLFDVVFQKQPEIYRARCRSDLVGGRTEWIELTPARLIEFTNKMRQWRGAVIQREKQELLGQELFDLLFRASSRRLLDRARGEAIGRGAPFLLRLCLEDDPVLAEVPWELMHDGFEFLARDPRCSMARTLENGRSTRGRPIRGPLRILLTSGMPRGDESLDLQREEQAIEKARLRTRGIRRPVVRRHVSWNDLEEFLEPGPEAPHIWLHCGHGDFLPSKGYALHLRGENGGDEQVSADCINELADRCPDLTLVLLACCHAGHHDGLASQLARLQVPIVVGFPWKVHLSVASQLAATLLRGLGSLAPEFACSSARGALASKSPDSLYWSRPLLFSRRPVPTPLLTAPKAPKPTARESPARRPKGPKVQVHVEDADVGGTATFVGSTRPVDGDVSVHAKGIKTRGSLVVRGLAAERRYRRELIDLLEELESETQEVTDA